MAREGKRGRPRVHSEPPASPEPPTMDPSAAPTSTGIPQPELAPLQQGINGTGPRFTQPATYAFLVDLEEGTALEFILVPEINGVKCAKVENEDIEEEVNY